MSSFVELSEASDSKLLPCSCSASWKLHSIAIKVMWSSREKRKEHFKKILMWLESLALLLSPLSVGVPITGVSRAIFSGFLSCSFKLTLKIMMMMRITKPRLDSRDQTKGHAETVRGVGNSRCYCCFSVKKHSERERRWNHILPSITSSHLMSLKASPMATIFWVGSWHLPKGRISEKSAQWTLHGFIELNSYLVLQGLHFWCIWSLKVPLGHVLQKPAQTCTLLICLPVTCKLTLCYMCSLLTVLWRFLTFAAGCNTEATEGVTTGESFFTATHSVACWRAFF